MKGKPDGQAVVQVGDVVSDQVPVGSDVVAGQAGLLARVIVEGEDTPHGVGTDGLKDGVHIVDLVRIVLEQHKNTQAAINLNTPTAMLNIEH